MSTRTETTLGPGPVTEGRHVLRFQAPDLEAARAFEAMARAIQEQNAEGWHVHIVPGPGGAWEVAVEYVHEDPQDHQGGPRAPRTLNRSVPSAEDLGTGVHLMLDRWGQYDPDAPAAQLVAGVDAILTAVAGGDLL